MTSITPKSIGQTDTATQQQNTIETSLQSVEKTSSFTFYAIGKDSVEKQEKILSTSNALKIYEKYQELKEEMILNPYSDKIQHVQQEFIRLLIENDAIPTTLSKDQLRDLTQPPTLPFKQPPAGILPFQTKAAEWFCNFATFGEGAAFPIIILPRFIPFILTPIPRAFIYWSTDEGFTSVGGLLSGTGFLAGGKQQGIALGFWGIGFSIFLPPIKAYGIFGYAIYTKVTAEQFQFYPPNTPPRVTQTDPADGQQFVSLSTKELRFAIEDEDNDLMSYSVTTEPDIGSDSGGLKPGGTYSIPISGLQDLTTYTWHVEVTDGKDTIKKTMTFTTEAIAPILSNPSPTDGQRDVPMDLPYLQFTLKDYQGDAMEYTVQTSPNIGSAHVTGVYDGTYTVPISGMTYGTTYRWFVNVTDGAHWTRRVYIFETGYPSEYDPFEFGWHYRKQITINHTYVAEDLENFPVFVGAVDIDLNKAQADGSDILFMDSPGVGKRIYHEIETFERSTGTLASFINIPSLSSTQDTELYLYYGNPDSINQEYPEKVWNSHFKAVWHLHESPSGTIHDSTTNNNDATAFGSMPPSNVMQGKVGKCLYFDGIDDYLLAPDSSSLKPVEVTILCWVNIATPVVGRCILGKGCTDKWGNKDAVSYGISHIDGEMGSNAEKDDNTQTIAKFNASQNTWYHAAMTYDSHSAMIHYYQNGLLRDNLVHGQSLRYASPWDFVFAAGHIGTGSGINYFVNCKIDEVWIVDSPLTPGWINTAYRSQNDPMNFLSFGLEETGP